MFKAKKGPPKNLRQTVVTSDTRVSLVTVLPKGDTPLAATMQRKLPDCNCFRNKDEDCPNNPSVGKIPTPIKIKLALPPPPLLKNPNKKEEFYGHGGFPAERTKKCQVPIKIGAAISGPRIMGGNSMDITLFLILGYF